MRLSLIGMAGSGKSYWSTRLAAHGFLRFCCDDLIAEKLAPELTGPDNGTLSMGEWMGFPYEPRYKDHESRYLASEGDVMIEIIEYLDNMKDCPEGNIVVDTTGSVIYTVEETLERLRRYTTIVYLSIPPQVREQLLEAYLTNPHPMVWRDAFHQEPHETNEEALARCYPILVSQRQGLYERYADVTIDYHRRRSQDFGVREFLEAARKIAEPSGPMRRPKNKRT
jgi:shikimate kinase